MYIRTLRTPARPTFHPVLRDRQVEVPSGVEKSLRNRCPFPARLQDNNREQLTDSGETVSFENRRKQA